MKIEPRTEVIPIRVTPNEADQIRAAAAADARPISQWARLRLVEFLTELKLREVAQ